MSHLQQRKTSCRRNARMVMRELIQRGKDPVYCRETLYPMLQVEATTWERSWQSLTPVEKLILELVHSGIDHSDALTMLTGFTKARMVSIIAEMTGKNLLCEEQQRILPGIFAEQSLKQNARVCEVKRSYLLCGLTGRCLPEKVSHQRVIPVGEALRRVDWQLLEPTPHLPETNLDEILSHRTIALRQIFAATPYFIECLVIVYREGKRSVNWRVAVCFEDTAIAWVDFSDVISSKLVAHPFELGYSIDDDSPTKEQILQNLEQTLETLGLPPKGGVTYKSRQVECTIAKIKKNDTVLANKVNGWPLIGFLSSSRHPAIPIHRITTEDGQDLLQGHLLFLRCKDDKLYRYVDLYRDIEAIRLAHNPNRHGQFAQYFQSKLNENGLDEDQVVELVEKARLEEYGFMLD